MFRFFNGSKVISQEMVIAAFQSIRADDELELKKLLWQGLDPNSRDEKGFTLLHKVVLTANSANEKLGLIELLVDAGADVNAEPNRGSQFTVLHTSVRRKLNGVVDFLLASGASPSLNKKDFSGNTPKYYAEKFNDQIGKSILKRLNEEKKPRRFCGF